jgi:hypothetical protein
MIRPFIATLVLLLVGDVLLAQDAPISGAAPAVPSSSGLVLARVKYSGGGDWYNDQEADVNMLEFLRKNTGINVRQQFEYVELTSDNIFNYPILFLTGHGNIDLSDAEAKRLRTYLDNGGFLYIDDDYDLDTAVRREMRKVFPEQELRELPFSHPIYHSFYEFPNGLPKIHEHNSKAPQGLGLFTDGNRLCVFYTTETNPSDGWADVTVHNNPPEKREAAFRIGANIVVYALTR